MYHKIKILICSFRNSSSGSISLILWIRLQRATSRLLSPPPLFFFYHVPIRSAWNSLLLSVFQWGILDGRFLVGATLPREPCVVPTKSRPKPRIGVLIALVYFSWLTSKQVRNIFRACCLRSVQYTSTHNLW